MTAETQVVVAFNDLSWEVVGPFCRMKRIVRGNKQVRLVEFQNGFEEDGWCENGHVGFVLQGNLNIQFPDRMVSANEGDVVWIPPGFETRHRAHVLGESVQLVLFEDFSEQREDDSP